MSVKNVLSSLLKWLPNLAILFLITYNVINVYVLDFNPDKEFRNVQIKKAFNKMSVIEKLGYVDKGDIVEFKNGSSLIIYNNLPEVEMFEQCDSIKKYAIYASGVNYSSISRDVSNVYIRRVDVEAWSEAMYRRMQLWNMGLLNK